MEQKSPWFHKSELAQRTFAMSSPTAARLGRYKHPPLAASQRFKITSKYRSYFMSAEAINQGKQLFFHPQ